MFSENLWGGQKGTGEGTFIILPKYLTKKKVCNLQVVELNSKLKGVCGSSQTLILTLVI